MPLTGIKVLDLSRVLAGPWCTQTLADLGADVWKIEEPSRGDDTRAWMPPEIDGESTYYMSANRTKRSIAVDLKHPEGQRIVREMALKADVLVENYKKGTLERFGLGYEELAALNPRLVYCSISGYGRTGPRADEAGYDVVIQAESGLMSITGEPEGGPLKHGMAIADLVTGISAGQAVLAALLARARTGKGPAHRHGAFRLRGRASGQYGVRPYRDGRRAEALRQRPSDARALSAVRDHGRRCRARGRQ